MKIARVAPLLSALVAFAAPHAGAAGALTVCLNEDAPPYSSRASGGFDLAVAEALARKLGRGLDVRWYESKLDEDSSGVLEANALLSDGKCQLVAGYPLTEDALGKPGVPTAKLPDFDGFKPSDRRRRIPLGTLQATKAYHFAPLAVIVGGATASKRIAGLGDLEGVRIGVESGTLSDTILMTYANGKLIDGITHLVPGRNELWPGLEHGDFDAALVPLHQFDAYRAKHADTRLKPSGYLFPLGFNLGFVGLASESALLAAVDAALADMLASGEIAALAPKAGMTYLPPRAPDVQKGVLLGHLKTD
jgi:ABC-type amino acid transport substrate-binding protein